MGAISGLLRDNESLSHLVLDEQRSALVAFVRKLFVDRAMVLARILAAFHHERNEWENLRVSVSGIVGVGGSL